MREKKRKMKQPGTLIELCMEVKEKKERKECSMAFAFVEFIIDIPCVVELYPLGMQK